MNLDLVSAKKIMMPLSNLRNNSRMSFNFVRQFLEKQIILMVNNE